MRRRLLILAVQFALVSQAAADVFEFTDKAEWLAAVGDFSTVDFTGFPHGTFITNQYTDLGLVFTDGNDSIFFNPSFVNDEWGLDGNPDIGIAFHQPQHWHGKQCAQVHGDPEPPAQGQTKELANSRAASRSGAEYKSGQQRSSQPEGVEGSGRPPELEGEVGIDQPDRAMEGPGERECHRDEAHDLRDRRSISLAIIHGIGPGCRCRHCRAGLWFEARLAGSERSSADRCHTGASAATRPLDKG